MNDTELKSETLAHFERNAPAVLAEMKRTGRAVVLTVDGRPSAVVLDVSSFKKLYKLAERMEMIEFLKKSAADVEAGRCVPAIEALDRMLKKYELKGKDDRWGSAKSAARRNRDPNPPRAAESVGTG